MFSKKILTVDSVIGNLNQMAEDLEVVKTQQNMESDRQQSIKNDANDKMHAAMDEANRASMVAGKIRALVA